jgi:hypothetical protein
MASEKSQDVNSSSEFVPANFWEALYGRMPDESQLNDIHGNAKAMVKLLLGEELLDMRRKFQVEIFKIDRELERLEANTFPSSDLKTLRQKFESAMASMKNENQK